MNRAQTIFACSYENCSSIFRKRERYECHLRMHSDERPFICTYDNCNKSYRRVFHLHRHEQSHEANFKCSFLGCCKVFKTKATLKKHIDTFNHKKELKEYKCLECDQKFNKHNMLQAHSFIHTGKLPYQCLEPDCNRSFLLPSRLKRHMKHHQEYTCESPDCLKSFPRWSLLLAHRKECHPKVFKCSICNKEFNFACNLKAHSLTHEDEREIFKCSVPKCIRFYQAKRHLTDHLKYFHETHPLSCPEENCPRFFKSEEEMKTHILWRHVPRSRKKKSKSQKPDFARILAGFDRGTKKDLNPQCSSDNSEGLNVNVKNTDEIYDNGEKSSKSEAINQEFVVKVITESKNVTSSTDNNNISDKCIESMLNDENLNFCGSYTNNVWNTFETITDQVM